VLIDAPDLSHKTNKELASLDLFQQLPAVERKIFQTRAKQLAQTADNQTIANQEAFAVIQLGLELYAIAVNEVREFCHLRQVTPIPCCPNYFMGNMNLRGDILTLIDVRPLLSLALDEVLTEVMVVESDGLRVGVPVTKVLDVMYLSATDYLPLPAYAHEINQDYCTTAIHYNGHIASLLDIKTLLTKGGLEVDEDV
jgi:purine-binding chemotaxis protein CheW